jgi:hypothetical protein
VGQAGPRHVHRDGVPPARCQLGGLLPPAEQPVLSVGQSDLRRALLCPRHAPQTALVERQLDRLGLAARSDVDVRVVGAPEDAPRLTSRAVAASDRPPDGAAGARSLRLGSGSVWGGGLSAMGECGTSGHDADVVMDEHQVRPNPHSPVPVAMMLSAMMGSAASRGGGRHVLTCSRAGVGRLKVARRGDSEGWARRGAGLGARSVAVLARPARSAWAPVPARQGLQRELARGTNPTRIPSWAEVGKW